MLNEFHELEERWGAEKLADVQRACRYLMQRQFVFSGDRRTAGVYNTLTDPRFKRVISNWFDCAGFRMEWAEEEQWVGIIGEDREAESMPKMKLEEAIVVLVLAANWQEDADLGNLSERAVSRATVNILYERYTDMIQGAGKPSMSVKRFFDLLLEIAVRSFIYIHPLDREEADRDVDIRPMIKYVSGADALARLETYLENEEISARRRMESVTPDADRALETEDLETEDFEADIGGAEEEPA